MQQCDSSIAKRQPARWCNGKNVFISLLHRITKITKTIFTSASHNARSDRCACNNTTRQLSFLNRCPAPTAQQSFGQVIPTQKKLLQFKSKPFKIFFSNLLLISSLFFQQIFRRKIMCFHKTQNLLKTFTRVFKK